MTTRKHPKRFLSPAAMAIAIAGAALTASRATDYHAAEVLCHLADEEIDESSGLEFSTANRDVFWTHNDDEDDNRLFALGPDGRTLGVHRLDGVEVHDWEDVSAFEKNGVSYLVCGDVGNKKSKHRNVHLYFFEEPEVAQGESDLKVLGRISFRFEDGYHNCEAMAVDVNSGSILLATKTDKDDDEDESGLYLLPLDISAGDEVRKARHIASLGIPKITSMDVSGDGRRAVILADEEVFEVERIGSEPWGEAARKRLRKVADLPDGHWEAVCYGSDGRTLYMTSEKKSTRMLVLHPVDEEGERTDDAKDADERD